MAESDSQKRSVTEAESEQHASKRQKQNNSHFWKLSDAARTARGKWCPPREEEIMPEAGFPLSSNTRRYYADEMRSASDRSVLPLRLVYGLDPLKATLDTLVRLPYYNPHLYNVNRSCRASTLSSSSEEEGPEDSGRLPLSQTIYFPGSRGSGKRLLVRSFAAEHDLTLYEAQGPGFAPAQELDGLYRDAVQHSPCIILFNDCEGFFAHGSPHCGQLWGWLDKIRRARLPVWTIFCANVQPSILDLSIQRMLDNITWAGVLTELDRERVWLAAFQSYVAGRTASSNSITPTCLKTLLRASEHCVARDIFNFVKTVFLKKVAKIGRNIELLPSDTPILPEDADFRECCFQDAMGRLRITHLDPREINVTPYFHAQQQQQEQQRDDHDYASYHK